MEVNDTTSPNSIDCAARIRFLEDRLCMVATYFPLVSSSVHERLIYVALDLCSPEVTIFVLPSRCLLEAHVVGSTIQGGITDFHFRFPSHEILLELLQKF